MGATSLSTAKCLSCDPRARLGIGQRMVVVERDAEMLAYG